MPPPRPGGGGVGPAQLLGGCLFLGPRTPPSLVDFHHFHNFIKARWGDGSASCFSATCSLFGSQRLDPLSPRVVEKGPGPYNMNLLAPFADTTVTWVSLSPIPEEFAKPLLVSCKKPHHFWNLDDTYQNFGGPACLTCRNCTKNISPLYQTSWQPCPGDL